MRDRIRIFLRRTYGSVFSPLTLVVWASAIAIAVLAEPFGTPGDVGPGQRTLFWGGTVSLSIILGYGARAVALALTGPERPGLCDAVAVALMTAVITPAVWALTRIAGDAGPGIAELAASVLVLSGAVFVVRRLTPGIEPRPYRFLQRPPPPADPAPARAGPPRPPRPRLLRRLPPAARGRVLRLAARDHRVDVVTDKGTTPLRLRLKDAVDEMEPVEGYSTHRSHWVARAAIDRVDRDGSQKLFVVLVNGDRVPVSRTYRADLEEAGIIARAGAAR